jgi:hypothetical protein
LAGLAGLKVGVVWQGNPRFDWDRWRSFPLTCLAPLAAVAGVSLVSLQKGPGAEQLRDLRGRFAVADLGEELDAEGGAFVDTAAVIAGLDLVVSPDTAVAHLAGALGARAWLALPAAMVDWRWMVGREDTPWYPSMRLFRQERLGEWRAVFERMAEELRRLAAERARRGVAGIDVSPGELVDRISILEIKSERLGEGARREAVRAELSALRAVRERVVSATPELVRLAAELRAANEALWEVEDGLRAKERAGDFGAEFVAMARAVYQTNDRRSALKQQINDLLGSPLREQKVYATEQQSATRDPANLVEKGETA